jgi:hypothetical protein
MDLLILGHGRMTANGPRLPAVTRGGWRIVAICERIENKLQQYRYSHMGPHLFLASLKGLPNTSASRIRLAL